MPGSTVGIAATASKLNDAVRICEKHPDKLPYIDKKCELLRCLLDVYHKLNNMRVALSRSATLTGSALNSKAGRHTYLKIPAAKASTAVNKVIKITFVKEA